MFGRAFLPAIISVLVALMLLAGLVGMARAAEPIAKGQPAPEDGIFFNIPTAERLLERTEKYDRLLEENASLDNVVKAHDALEAIRIEREKLYQDRIAFQDEQIRALERINKVAIDAAEAASKSEERSRKVGTIKEFGLLGILAIVVISIL